MHYRKVFAELDRTEATGTGKLAQTLAGKRHLVGEVAPEYPGTEDTLGIGHVHDKPSPRPKHPVSLIHDLENLILAEMLDHIEGDYHVENFTGAVAQERNEVAEQNRADS
jgi:hypothetical protein